MMNVNKQIEDYINSLAEPKAIDITVLHKFIVGVMPNCKLWFLDGKNSEEKIVSNANIGYGQYTIQYANGSSKDFYQIGISANTTGISVYIMGIADKTFLTNTYASKIGKATVSGYCIKFKNLKDIHFDVLAEAIKYGLNEAKKGRG